MTVPFQTTSQTRLSSYRNSKNYGRVCCFKGFDEESFSFNTRADGSLFARQFDLFQSFLDLGIDVYAYVTLTSPNADRISDRIKWFVDKLQSLHPVLPLRTVPLEIQAFTPVRSRVEVEEKKALEIQHTAVEAWNLQIEERYSLDERTSPITEVALEAKSK